MGQRFRGQVVVITGASSGIGRATAEAFAREGARLVLGARRKEELETVAASLRRGGREARAVQCDVTIPRQVKRLADAALDRWERIDVVVANAGIGLSAEFLEMERDDFRQVMETNVHGVVNTLNETLPSMVERKSGTAVIVSSVLGHRGIPRFSGYCASKAALNGLSESLRTELEPHGVKVLLACPGLTDTEFFERRLGKPRVDAVRDLGRAMPADVVGKRIVEAVLKGKPRIVLTTGGRLLTSTSRHLPRVADRLAAWWHRRELASSSE